MIEPPEKGDAVGFAREQYEERLKALAAAPRPRRLSSGACCYAPAPPMPIIFYACPRCGSRSFLNEEDYPLAAWEVDACRELMRELGDLPATLLEEGFCENCHPGVEKGTLALLVNHGGGVSHRVEGIRSGDLLLLKEFLNGRKVHEGSYGEETPMRNHIPRLRELLGLPAESSE